MIAEPGRWTEAVPRRRLRLDHVPRGGRRAAGPAGPRADPRGRARRPGLSVKPATPLAALDPYRDLLDIVLVMTVEPGFGGQAFMADVADAKLRSGPRLARSRRRVRGPARRRRAGRDRRGHRARRDRRHRGRVGALPRRRHGGRGRADPLDRERRPVADARAAPPARPPRARAPPAGQPRRGPRGGRAPWARSGRGLLVLLGVGHGDDEATADALARRICELRIFEDDEGRTNRSLLDVGGEALVVSQFTLYADTSPRAPAGVHGRRGARRSRGRCGSGSRARSRRWASGPRWASSGRRWRSSS